MTRTHHRTCNLCEAMCGVTITVDGPPGAEKILSIKGDEQDPLSLGHICPKAVALQDIHEDEDRLRRPMERIGDDWREIGWEEAFDKTAAGLAAVRDRHGRNAVGFYQGNPTVHNHGSLLYGQFLSKALGTKNRFSATSLDQLPHMLAGLKMFGHQLLLPIPDIDRTRYMLMLGANPVISNGSLMSAGNVAARLKKVERLIVVDPRRTETAKIANEHLAIHPGTDALFLAALIRTVLAERSPRLRHLSHITDGLDAIRSAVEPFSPEQVAGPTRIPAEVIRRIALELHDVEPAVVYGRVGVCTQEFGGLAAWLINVLNIVTGNLDRPGGAMFTNPAVDLIGVANYLGLKGSYDRRRSRVRKLPEFGGEFPASVLAEEIETPGDGQIRGLLTSAGNPVLSAPNGRRLDAAFAGLEFMVSIDIYLNETTRHANLILPPTFALEHDHYDLAFHVLAVRNTAKYSPPLFERGADAKEDWEIFLALTKRLAQAKGPADRARLWAQQAFLSRGPRAILELGLRLGPHRLSLAKLEKHPHGIDLGPLQPCMPDRLQNDTGRIELAPKTFVEDMVRLRSRIDRQQNGVLSLVGRRELRTNNSWMHNSHRMVKGKERCTLRMHPEDARSRDLSDGQVVEVKSRVGAVRVPLEISDEMLPGVVSMPHGWGHDRAGIRLTVAAERPGASINDVTDDDLLDPLSGTVQFSDVPVTVTA